MHFQLTKLLLFFNVFIFRHAYCQKKSKYKIGMEVNGLCYVKVVTEVKIVTVVLCFRTLCSLVLDANISEE